MSAKYLYDGSNTSKLFLDRRKFYLQPQEYAELWPNVTPFSTLLANTNKKSGLPDPLFKLFEHENPWIKQEFQINGSPGTVPNDDTGLGSISIDGITGLASTPDSSYVGLECEVWDSTKTTKRGVIAVTAVSADPYLTVKLLGTSTFVLTDNDYCVVMGNVRGEGSTAGEAWSDELSVVYNSTQFFSKPVEVTGKLYRASLRGANDELARLRKQKGEEFKMQQEHAFLKGSNVIGTGMSGTALTADTYRTDGSGYPLRTTMGIIPIIETYGSSTATDDNQNIFQITEAAYDYTDFVDDMEKVFQYESGSGQKFAFCGPGAMSYWSKLDNSQFFAGRSGWSVQLSGTMQNKLGFNIRKLETPHGILHLVPTKALKYQYNKYMLIVDESNLFHAEYEPNTFKHNIKTDDDYNGVKDVYNGDIGIGVTLQKSHQLFKIV